MRVFVEGVGVLGPGLAGWPRSREILARREPYRYEPTVVKPSELLPPAERRRAGVPVNLALIVGREALANAGRDAATTAAVFSSSSGDGEILHRICETLATSSREVSPTSFLNSVHNVAAGYWSIATSSRAASASLCAHDASFAAGLLEATAQAVVECTPIVLIAYDQPYPEPLHSARTLGEKFAVALVIAAEASQSSVAELAVDFVSSPTAETPMFDARLEAVRATNPAARSLPLLAALARGESGRLTLPYLESAHLAVGLKPC